MWGGQFCPQPAFSRLRRAQLACAAKRGSSDGLTIGVAANQYINQIAQRTVLSDDALSVLVPVLETIVGWTPLRIREFFEGHGFVLREWDKVQTDSLTICRVPVSSAAASAGVAGVA